MGCGSSQPKEDGVEKPEAKPPQTDNAAAAPPSDELQKVPYPTSATIVTCDSARSCFNTFIPLHAYLRDLA